MMTRRTLTALSLATIAVFVLFVPGKAAAATMWLQPSASSVSKGNTFTVNVLVGTDGKPINNAESTIQYPADLLDVVSVSKNPSIFTLWVEEPTDSGDGKIDFNGGLPSPGYTGDGGRIMSVVFRAKETGKASLAFSDPAVLANDGLGTNVLTQSIGTDVAIVNAAPVKKTPPPTPPVELPVNTVAATSTIIVAITPLMAPTITGYPHEIVEGGLLPITGHGAEDATISISMTDQNGFQMTQTTRTTTAGDYTMLWNGQLRAGSYRMKAQMTDNSGTQSPYSADYPLAVNGPSTIGVSDVIVTDLPYILFAIIIIVLIIHGYHDRGKKDMMKMLALLESIRNRRPLSKEEREMIEICRRYLK